MRDELYGDIWLLKNGEPSELFTDEGDYYDYFKKLSEYEDAEEHGLLIRLPCKVGDVVYAIEDDCNRPSDCGYDCEKCPDGKKSIYSKKFSSDMIEKIGENVFLTHEEAEQKLKKLEEL